MADHHTRHNPLGQDTLFTTPASLMLDTRLTPLERNGWQVLRMLRSAEGISPRFCKPPSATKTTRWIG